MDGRGGCCIARYAGGRYDVASKVDRIMLRFRPIAPKPASAGGFSSAGVVPEGGGSQKSDGSSFSGRKKRRILKEGDGNSRVTKRCGGKKKRSLPDVSAFGGGEAVAVRTLPLLPETPDVKESVGEVEVKDGGGDRVVPYKVMEDDTTAAPGSREAAAAAVSWVRVERITDRWVLDRYGCDVVLGRTDVEKVMSLDLDTCPGFVSDCFNNVRWINEAYRKMAAAEDVVVRVVVEEGVSLPAEWAAFTCRVRVVTSGVPSTLPCDVWRMDCGGFAWRLDTKAALSLGL